MCEVLLYWRPSGGNIKRKLIYKLKNLPILTTGFYGFGVLILGHKGTAGKNSDFVGLVLCDLVSVEKSTAGKVSAEESFADLS